MKDRDDLPKVNSDTTPEFSTPISEPSDTERGYPSHELDYIKEMAGTTFPSLPQEYAEIIATEWLLDIGAHPLALLDTIGNKPHTLMRYADSFLANGVSPAELLSRVDKAELEPKNKYLYDEFLLTLLRAGGDGTTILPLLSEGHAYAYKDELLALDVDPQVLFDNMDDRKMRLADKFEGLGVHIDGQAIADSLRDAYKVIYFDSLTKYGAVIDVQTILDNSKSDRFTVSHILGGIGALIKAAPEIDFQAYVDAQNPSELAIYGKHLQENGITVDGPQLLDQIIAEKSYVHEITILGLLELGADPNKLYSYYRKADHIDGIGQLGPFIRAGVELKNINRILNNTDAKEIAYHLSELLAVGAKIDIDELTIALDDNTLSNTLTELLKNGLRIDNYYLGRLSAESIRKNYDALTGIGFEADVLDNQIEHNEAQKKAMFKAAESLW